MKIFIEPNDVLMFRGGRPFSGGEDHFARGIFPPPPSTFYGAIRSKILSEKYPQYESFSDGIVSENVKKEIGTPSVQGSLTITSFLLAKRIDGVTQPIFPIPSDLVKIKGKDEKIFILKPDEKGLVNKMKPNFPTSTLTALWLKTELPIEKVDGFLSMEMMDKYLQDETPNKVIKGKDLYQKDERVGIKKERIRKAAATGALYSVEYFRLNDDVGFIVELDGINDFPKEGLLRLGGDHRSAFYRESEFLMPDIEMIRQKVESSKRFKIILLTPAIFNNGWIPDWIDVKSSEAEINGISLKLVSAAIDKPVYIGGFDLVKRIPKEMKKAVQQGGVYYFKLTKGNVEDVFRTFWLKSISEERRKEGFGTAIIGGY